MDRQSGSPLKGKSAGKLSIQKADTNVAGERDCTDRSRSSSVCELKVLLKRGVKSSGWVFSDASSERSLIKWWVRGWVLELFFRRHWLSPHSRTLTSSFLVYWAKYLTYRTQLESRRTQAGSWSSQVPRLLFFSALGIMLVQSRQNSASRKSE